MIEPTTKVGIVNNCLSYLQNCDSKGAFTYAVILGLGSNFNYDLRSEFATMAISISGERLADPKYVLLNYFDV